jgi:hypothetical protein
METTTAPVVFLAKDNRTWVCAVRTPIGFQHVMLGRITGMTKPQAVEQALLMAAEGRLS